MRMYDVHQRVERQTTVEKPSKRPNSNLILVETLMFSHGRSNDPIFFHFFFLSFKQTGNIESYTGIQVGIHTQWCRHGWRGEV